MTIDILRTADALSNEELLGRLDALAGRERVATVELIAHLAALERRPSLYAAKGYGSLFGYCTEALRLSEDAACNRIAAAKACRAFPVVLEWLASGDLTLTSVRLIGPHLTPENHRDVLEKAKGRSKRGIEALVVELAPRPDVPTSIRRLPTPASCPAPDGAPSAVPPPPSEPTNAAPISIAPSFPGPVSRPIVQPTSPARYRAQFTMGEEMHARLRRVQSLLRREIPDGDPAAIFDRALKLLEEQIEKTRLGAAKRSRAGDSIRPGADRPSSRNVPRAVRRTVWQRDGGQCAYASPDGHRCTERTFLEFHHVVPYARGGPGTADNISLRCRRHNQYEAEIVFGARIVVQGMGERRDSWRDAIRTPLHVP
jgi:hypothetical protein